MIGAMNKETITFEQPLNETIRLCLRLEHLFVQFHDQLSTLSASAHHLAMLSLLKLLGVIDRPDLKSKITQALSQHATTLAQLQQFSQVDQQQLSAILKQLDQCLSYFHGNHTKIGDILRSNSFLNQIYGHLNNPAGLCGFSSPAYALWQKKALTHQQQQLKEWMTSLDTLYQATQLILTLTRDSTDPKAIEVEDGFYHQQMDATLPTQLIRISIPLNLAVYPEMSVGRHHLSVRFLQTNAQGQGLQYKPFFSCQLACCRI